MKNIFSILTAVAISLGIGYFLFPAPQIIDQTKTIEKTIEVQIPGTDIMIPVPALISIPAQQPKLGAVGLVVSNGTSTCIQLVDKNNNIVYMMISDNGVKFDGVCK